MFKTPLPSEVHLPVDYNPNVIYTFSLFHPPSSIKETAKENLFFFATEKKANRFPKCKSFCFSVAFFRWTQRFFFFTWGLLFRCHHTNFANNFLLQVAFFSKSTILTFFCSLSVKIFFWNRKRSKSVDQTERNKLFFSFFLLKRFTFCHFFLTNFDFSMFDFLLFFLLLPGVTPMILKI